MCMALVAETSVVMYIIMCMAFVAETSVVMYVYAWPWWPRPRRSCMFMALELVMTRD